MSVESSERLEFVVSLSDALRPLKDPLDIQDAAARLLGVHLGVNRVIYAGIDGDEFIVERSYVEGVAPFLGRGRVAAFGAGLLDAYRRGETVIVNDVRTDPRLTDAERTRLLGNDIAAFVGLLVRKDRRRQAAFGVHSATPRLWTCDQIALVEETGERAWAAAARARATDALRTSEARLAFLLRLNDAIRHLSDPAEVQETTARLLGRHLGVNRVGYAELDEQGYRIRCEYAHGVAPLVGHGPLGTFGAALRDAYRRGETVVVADVQTDPRFTDAERLSMREREIAAFVGVTLLRGERIVAAFGANQATPRRWTPIEIALVRDVAERTWDAVERTRAEAALREREQRLRLALDASAGGSWTWDPRTNQVDWDESFRVRYGFTPDEPATFDSWLSRVHEDDRRQTLGILDELLHGSTRDAWDYTYRIVHPDGRVLWMQSLGRVDRDADGVVARLTGLELDITERRQADEALQARRDEERDRELRLLLETATQGIVSVDARGAIATANRALETMFGWAPGELIGQPLERLLPSSLLDVDAGHRHLVGERKDGSTFPIEVSLNHVATPRGGRAIAFVTDITDRQRAEVALQERTAELERRTTQLSQLASDLTLAEQRAREQLAKTLHDGLQQLLVGAALNLDRRLTRDEQQRIPADALLSEARDHVEEAITAARSLSVELFPPVLHASGLPDALAWLAGWTRSRYGLTVEVSVDPLANPDRKDVRTLLFESVRELLFNAVKHARVDRVTVDLARDSDNALCITVSDEGVGFDAAALIDQANTRQIGWGLFSIRERLTLLGGRFDIESAPGQGTRFRLIVPRADAAPVADARRPPSRAASVDALEILIVDDHAAVRRVLRNMLQERPELHVVGEAANGLEAIAQAHALLPDVILMDVSMPEMDGIEATRRIRAELPFIQIFGLSTYTRAEATLAIERAGAAGFFTKSTDMQRLIARLCVLRADEIPFTS
jgi:PAS domain S-box-containing protein